MPTADGEETTWAKEQKKQSVAGAGGPHFSEKFRSYQDLCSLRLSVANQRLAVSPSLHSFIFAFLICQTIMSTVKAEEGPSPALGVRVSLPPGTLAAQREKELARRSQHNQQQQQQEVQAVEEDEEEGHDDEGPRPIGIDLDREIVPFHLGGDGNSSDGSSNSEPGLQDEEDASSSAASDDIDDDDDDDISQSPPTCLPLLSIDLIELTGCKPSNAEEKDMLVDQVRAILVGEHNEDGSAGEEEAKRHHDAEEGPPPEESEANDEQEPQ